MLWVLTSPFLFPYCHKRLDGVLDKGPKESGGHSMAGHLLRSPLFEIHQNESRVGRSLRVGVRARWCLYDCEGIHSIKRAQLQAILVGSWVFRRSLPSTQMNLR